MQTPSVRNDNASKSPNNFTKALLFIYSIVLVWILIFKLGVQFSYMATRSYNLIPFGDLIRNHAKADKAELILNILIFIPLGVYSGVLFKNGSWKKQLFVFFLVTLLLEGVQFIFRIGAFDITDIFTNLLGGLTGLLIYRMIEKLFNNSRRSHQFINVMAGVGTLIMVSLLVLLKLNMLPVRYQ